MDERRHYRIAIYARLVDERFRELALYESGVRICEGHEGRLVDVTDETMARLRVERAWFQEQVARIQHETPRTR